jgi:hypothetical protein
MGGNWRIRTAYRGIWKLDPPSRGSFGVTQPAYRRIPVSDAAISRNDGSGSRLDASVLVSDHAIYPPDWRIRRAGRSVWLFAPPSRKRFGAVNPAYRTVRKPDAPVRRTRDWPQRGARGTKSPVRRRQLCVSCAFLRLLPSAVVSVPLPCVS